MRVVTIHCDLHGYGHPESPPCPPEHEPYRKPRVCPEGHLFCSYLSVGSPGLTPPVCRAATAKRKSA